MWIISKTVVNARRVRGKSLGILDDFLDHDLGIHNLLALSKAWIWLNQESPLYSLKINPLDPATLDPSNPLANRLAQDPMDFL